MLLHWLHNAFPEFNGTTEVSSRLIKYRSLVTPTDFNLFTSAVISEQTRIQCHQFELFLTVILVVFHFDSIYTNTTFISDVSHDRNRAATSASPVCVVHIPSVLHSAVNINDTRPHTEIRVWLPAQTLHSTSKELRRRHNSEALFATNIYAYPNVVFQFPVYCTAYRSLRH